MVKSAPILFVADLFHPVDDLSIERFLNRDMRYSHGGCDAVPVLLVRWKPHHVAGTNLFEHTAFALHPAATRGDNQSLTQTRAGAGA